MHTSRRNWIALGAVALLPLLLVFAHRRSSKVLSETFTATNIVATSTITTPTYKVTGGTTPTITVCNASPPTAVAPAGSMCLDTTNSRIYQTTGGGAWAQVGGGGASSPAWTSVFSDTLMSGALTGYTQQHGVWTAIAGTGFQTDDGGTENYLSLDNGEPIPVGCVTTSGCAVIQWALQVEFLFTASALPGTGCGLVLRGNAAPVSGGTIRSVVQFNGINTGYDVFGSSSNGHNTQTPFTTGTWHTLNILALSMRTDTPGFIDMAVDGAIVFQGQPTAYGTITFSRVGLWAGLAHCQFRNFKVFLPAPAQ